MKNYSNKIIAIWLCGVLIAAAAVLGGCAKPQQPAETSVSTGESVAGPVDGPITGGVTDKTNPDAPKIITSREISELHAQFFLIGEWHPGTERDRYTFDLAPDDSGALTLTERTTGYSVPADPELAMTLQEIIEAQKLAEQNGYYRVTAGLAPEYGECFLNVLYASGETLRFTMDNDPEAPWAKAMYLAFADWFAKQGEPGLLPPAPNSQVARLTLEFLEEDRMYSCGTWKAQAQGDDTNAEELPYKVCRDIYDLEKEETVVNEVLDVPADYYERLTEILSAWDLRPYDPQSVLYEEHHVVQDEEDSWWDVLSLHIDYEDGTRVYIDMSDREHVEELRPLVNEILEYHASLSPEHAGDRTPDDEA